MTWLPTAALSRALGVGGVGVAAAVLLGEPAMTALVAPLLVVGVLGLVHRPHSRPRLTARVEHATLHEGQGTRSHLLVDDLEEVEQVTRMLAPVPYVAVHPADGCLSAMVARGLPTLEISARRWGRRTLGDEGVALTSAWAGYRWGPVTLVGNQLQVLPVRAAFASHAEVPHPQGLIGAHRSNRTGEGSEFASIRPFQSGDRLRRINWRVSLREDALHVVTARGEEDSGILLVVDALADHGRSGGIDGDQSSLDVAVRAAAALAEHHIRAGDRVSLRVVGVGRESVAFGSGKRHLRLIQNRLALVVPGELRGISAESFQLRATAGTVVMVFSPMLSDAIAAATAAVLRSGLPVLVVDTLSDQAAPAVLEGTDPRVADLAWRMRRLEREQVLERLSGIGCPVVAWRGPGTLDDVLRRLARRSQLPRVTR